MMRDFVTAVQAVKPDVTPEEMADVLWLADKMGPAAPTSPTNRSAPEVEPGEMSEPPVAQSPLPDPPQRSTTRSERVEPFASFRLRPRRLWGDGSGVWTHSPAARVIPDGLAIGRALRPLQRRVPSSVRTRPDENATAQSIADTGLWVPSVRPVFERWLDVAFVTDDSESMDVWRQTVSELRNLLERSGAFRDVRTWRLDGDLVHGASVSVSAESSVGGTGRDPSELIDPTGRRLVLIASDCVGRAWASGAMGPVMSVWAAAGPTVIVQMLPQRLWSECVPEFVPVRFRSAAPGVPNSRMIVQSRDGEPDGGMAGIPVPVIALEARWLKQWAALVAGATSGWVNGAAMFTGSLAHSRIDNTDFQQKPIHEATTRELLLSFRARATPEAYQLMVYLAGAPLSLSVMRLVQSVMLPNSRPSHLAEVFLSSLLVRTGADDESQEFVLAAETMYDFRPGVRAELLAEMTRSDALQVLARVSAFVSQRMGSPLDFRALLTVDDAMDLVGLDAPFAQVAYQVLQSLGGRYAEAAERLTRMSDIRRPGASSRHHEGQNQPLSYPKSPQGAELTTSPPMAVDRDRRTEVRPSIMRGVPLRNPHFTGRDQMLSELRSRLENTSERTALLPHALHGLGGVGKTQLAVEYVHRYRNDYDLIWWIAAEDPTEIRTSLVELGAELGIAEGADVSRTIRAVIDALRTSQAHRRWLLVFDNADRPDDLVPYLPYPTGHVLITSRNLGWSEVASTVEVDVFSREESIALLRDRGRNISDVDADRLADRLGDLPLALEQAAAWRAETGMPVDEYLELFDGQLEQLTELKPSNYPAPVGATYRLAFERLREQSPAAAQLLELAAFFGSEPIPVSLLWDGRNANLPSPLDQTMRDSIRMRRALRDIGRYALARIDPVQDRISVHRLVQAVLRSRLSEEQQEETRRLAQRILALASPSQPDDERNWYRHAELSPHVIPVGTIDSEDTEVRRVSLDQVRYRYVRGDYEGSRELGELVVAAWQEKWGDADELTLLAGRHLANTLRALGENERARELASRTLERMRQVLGSDNEHTLSMVDTVAWDLRIAGEFRNAKELDEDNFRRHRRVFGDDDPVTVRIQNNFAIDLRWLGEFGLAREVDLDSVRRRRELYGNEDRRTQLAVSSLARDCYGLGMYTEALTLQERALSIQRRVLGSQHSEVLSERRNLIIILRKLGHYVRARDEAEDLLRAYQGRFGDVHERTLAAMTSAANALRCTNDLVRARLLCAEALEHYRHNFGDSHPFTLACASNLAIVLRHLDRSEEALALNQVTLEAFGRVLGPDHPFTLCCATNTANDLATLHRHHDALELSEDTLRRSREVRGNDHPYTFACAFNLALDLRVAGRDSGVLRTEAIAGFERHLGKDHPETFSAIASRRADCDIESPET